MVDEAIVLAGGLGTRLRGVVDDVPKPLAPVAGRPFLAWLLDALGDAGIRRAILATGHLSDLVEQAIGHDWGGLDIAYSRELQPLGTGGALRQARGRLHGSAAHVVNGDTFLRYEPAKLQASATALNAPLAMALANVPDVSRYGAVECAAGRVVRLCEKGAHGSGWINAGCYFLSEGALRALEDFPARFSFETECLTPWVAARNVAAFCETRDFIDIGTPEDFGRAQGVVGHVS